MTRTTRVLEHDRTLRDLVPREQAADALAASVARVIDVPAGAWAAQEQADAARGGVGLMCLEGLQLRRVGLHTSYGAELLGPGDLLRPWQQDGEVEGLPVEDASWRVIAPSSLAVLDIRWAMRMAPWPAVGCELVGRALERSLRLATLMAISQHRRLDVRLRLLLWKLADRFGVVRRDGVHLEIPLTHEALSLLAVARRPSVSTCLRRLADAGELRQERRHIVLLGAPPEAAELEAGAQAVDTNTFLSSV
jgi:CRP/FNR family transcriptional regulator, cyclic AMP receptor protein